MGQPSSGTQTGRHGWHFSPTLHFLFASNCFLLASCCFLLASCYFLFASCCFSWVFHVVHPLLLNSISYWFLLPVPLHSLSPVLCPSPLPVPCPLSLSTPCPLSLSTPCPLSSVPLHSLSPVPCPSPLPVPCPSLLPVLSYKWDGLACHTGLWFILSIPTSCTCPTQVHPLPRPCLLPVCTHSLYLSRPLSTSCCLDFLMLLLWMATKEV